MQALKRKAEWQITFDIILAIVLSLALILNWLHVLPSGLARNSFIVFSIIGVLPVIKSAISALFRKKLTVDLLASIALFFSFLSGAWFSAVFINLMLASARIFDGLTQKRAKNIIERLLKYRPSKVKIKKEDKIIEIPLGQIKKGNLVVVESGERISVDGIVVSGQANVNQSTLTGESEPVLKTKDDYVFSSTLNESGSLLVRAEKVGEDTTLAKIVSLISETSREKARVENVADKFTGWYILFSLVGSAALYLFSQNLFLVLSILLVTCADDIAVAIPLSFTAAIARAARRGIIVKGADVFENLTKVNIFLTDKTGTLSRGKPKVTRVVVCDNFKENKFLEFLGTAEINSRHPAGRAIVKFLQKKNINIPAPDEFNEVPGEGIWIIKNKEKFFAGKILFLEKNGVEITADQKKLVEEIKARGGSITALSFKNKLIGFAVLEDELRPFSKELISHTKNLGVRRWIMLTGDNEKVAEKTARTLAIDEFHANLTPEDKIKFIRELKAKNGKLAMIGDGVNDAPALALADVSFAMAAIGSDAAIEAADIALMHDELNRIPEIMVLSKKTLKVVRQNFWLWGTINGLGLFLVFGGILGPVGASAYNFITDFFPIFNALKIFDKKW
jgi:Cd2+/Zn2+-exporting ATPase